ncbi:uncharacterized protein LOC124935695 isoform X2 [Impatiens glandulifera]|uniref:uncharacterized protein LOC124935695 isoform X2 n=1 Tax=Impatiens glandulifera TaxID=253017 RepID=UPI001FB0BA8C|nr:uncharacterized protein LOC124935695 isoform X2 [Impatiens glandulifera]
MNLQLNRPSSPYNSLYQSELRLISPSSSSSSSSKLIQCFSNATKLTFSPEFKRIRHPFLRKPLQVLQVKSEEDSKEITTTGESILLNEQSLEHQLQIAVQEEDYAKAAKLRDRLRILQEDTVAAVLAANARFYNSFRTGDLAAMQALWAKRDNVCVVHPGVSGISGYDLVMGSWEFVWADYDFPLKIDTKEVQVHVRGDMGYVTCIEMVRTKGKTWGRQFATNVFERIGGQWFISIHHASYIDI